MDLPSIPINDFDETKVICLTLARSRYEAKRCRHLHITVDEDKAEVECSDCGEKLNAVATLVRFSNEESRLRYRIDEMKKVSQQLDAKIRCKCQHCGQMTRVRT